MKLVARLSTMFVVALLLVVMPQVLNAASPMGYTATTGLQATCTFQPLSPSSQVWYQVPYRNDYRLQMTLDDYAVKNIGFQVFASADQAADPIGLGTYNRNEPTHDLNWEGRLMQNGVFYVLVTNSNLFQIDYRFCVKQKDPFYPPPMILPTPRPCFASPGGEGLLNRRCEN